MPYIHIYEHTACVLNKLCFLLLSEQLLDILPDRLLSAHIIADKSHSLVAGYSYHFPERIIDTDTERNIIRHDLKNTVRLILIHLSHQLCDAVQRILCLYLALLEVGNRCNRCNGYNHRHAGTYSSSY